MGAADEPLIGIEATAEILGTNVRHIRRLVAERRISFLKVGGKLRFDPADIRAYKKRQRVGAVS